MTQLPVTAFPQQNILICPSSPINMNLLQMHMYTQLRTMMDPGNTLHNTKKKNVLQISMSRVYFRC